MFALVNMPREGAGAYKFWWARSKDNITPAIRAALTSVVVNRRVEGGRIVEITFADVTSQKISPWHGLPQLHAWETGFAVFIAEIPEGTTGKFEVTTAAEWNPIRQDTMRNGAPRHYPTPAPFTYGMLPRTFSDPRVKDGLTGFEGDGDPLDAIEISGIPAAPGEVMIVRVLGAFAMQDGGHTDWKIVVARESAHTGVTGTFMVRLLQLLMVTSFSANCVTSAGPLLCRPLQGYEYGSVCVVVQLE